MVEYFYVSFINEKKDINDTKHAEYEIKFPLNFMLE